MALEWIRKGKVVNHHVPYWVLKLQYRFDESGQHQHIPLV